MGEKELHAQQLMPELFQRVYNYADASRITNVHIDTVRNWYKGYHFTYEDSDNNLVHSKMGPVVLSNKFEQNRKLCFLDLIDLLYIAKFRELGFSLQHLRKYLDVAAQTLNTVHLANQKFFASGKDILLELPNTPENILSLNKRYQLAFLEIFEPLSSQVKYENLTGFGYVNEWSPPNFEGEVIINPKIASGFPVLVGTRITTKIIFDLYRGEKEEISPVANWFGINRRKVRTAIQYEMSLAA
jgi:uncharacterized protein (DUF433 family)/DNA-binding transcriptional MerR regulator